MFESLGFETLTAPQAAVWFALAIGAVFGGLAQITRFCLRRAVVGERRKVGKQFLVLREETIRYAVDPNKRDSGVTVAP